MARHAAKSTGNGQGNYDPARSKDVREAGGGRHSGEDKGDQDDQDQKGDQDDQDQKGDQDDQGQEDDEDGGEK
jgi:hypothetical protein